MQNYDIHLRGGTVVDGTRAPRYQADVWINDGKIAKIIQKVTERNVKIVAEHVEDATAMAQLWQMGVHYVQGDQTETI